MATRSGQDHDGREAATPFRAALQVGRPVAGVHVADGDEKARDPAKVSARPNTTTIIENQEACITTGGFHSPLPAGRIDGGFVFGQ